MEQLSNLLIALIYLTDRSFSLYLIETNKIEGLPKAWLNLLQNAKISEADQSNNPKAVVDALKYYCQAIKKPNQNKYLVTQDTLDRIRDVDCDWKRTSSEDDSIKGSSRDDLLSIEDLDYFSDGKSPADGQESKHVKLIGERQKIDEELSIGQSQSGDKPPTKPTGILSDSNKKEHIYDVVPTVPRKITDSQSPSSNKAAVQENEYANINNHQIVDGNPAAAGQPNSHQTFLISNNQPATKAAIEPQPRRRNNKKINNPETERQLIQTLKVCLHSKYWMTR